MPIDPSDVRVGGIYATPNNQERLVSAIEDGHVHYQSRGGNVQNDWSPGHTKANPPTLENFAEACDKILS